jgi:hypothetical protein
VSCPFEVKPIGCKWAYSVAPDGSLDMFKACLMALWNHQEYGVNYDETFAPVTKSTTVHTILDIDASHHWSLSQMDV